MANMSYCRFENTANDLQDCLDNLNSQDRDGEPLSKSETEYRKRLIELCQEVVDSAEDIEEDSYVEAA